MLGSCLSLDRFAEWIERRSWPVQSCLWALSCYVPADRPSIQRDARRCRSRVMTVIFGQGTDVSFGSNHAQKRGHGFGCNVPAVRLRPKEPCEFAILGVASNLYSVCLVTGLEGACRRLCERRGPATSPSFPPSEWVGRVAAISAMPIIGR
jgi:hypothetical protein